MFFIINMYVAIAATAALIATQIAIKSPNHAGTKKV